MKTQNWGFRKYPGGAKGAGALWRLPESIISHCRRIVKFVSLAGRLAAGLFSAVRFYGVISSASAGQKEPAQTPKVE